MAHPELQLPGYTFTQLFAAEHLARLDAEFLASLKASDASLCQQLLEYRRQSRPFAREESSTLLIAVAGVLARFLGHFFAAPVNCRAIKKSFA